MDANGDVIGHLIIRCYEAAGFTAYAKSEYKMPIGTWNCTDMELHIGGTR